MKKFLLLFLLLSANMVFAKKYAIIIAVGEYPEATGWTAISSTNDVPLIKGTLLAQGFSEGDIVVLENSQATKQAILTHLKQLEASLLPGDIVVIHYSGHGQQIFDTNSEEIDGLDEAIVPFDAGVRYTDTYQGENHLRDDEIANILAAFRNKLGADGQLLMLLDSCHSGSATRGAKARGSQSPLVPGNWEGPTSSVATKGSDMFEKVSLTEDAAPFVLISGASAKELNYEYEGQGSLSYSFSKAMNELGSDFTYRQLYSKIAGIMNVISPQQTPTIEGDIDYKLFNGDYIQQQPYFETKTVLRPDVIRIQAGKIHGIFEGTTFHILPAGSTTVEESEIITTGEVVLSKFNEATLRLEKPLPNDNEKEYWVFLKERTYGDLNLNVFLDHSLKEGSISSSISEFLTKNQLGALVIDSLLSNVTIGQQNDSYVLKASKGLTEIGSTQTSRGAAGVEQLQEQLFSYAQGLYLKNLHMDNRKYEFSFRLLPLEYDPVMEEFGDTLAADAFVDLNGMFSIRPEEDHVILEVTNHSKIPLYFSIIEINSKGEINPFLPNNNCNLNDNERRLEPGQTMLFRDCIFRFAPPYEKLVLKGFASDQPINFQPSVQSRGASTRGTSNPLEKFLSQTYTKSRGSGGQKVNGKVDGYSTEFLYEIVPNQ